MRQLLSALVISSLVWAGLVACQSSKPTSPQTAAALHNVIPKPVSVTAKGKTFVLTSQTPVYYSNDDSLKGHAYYLVKMIGEQCKLNLMASSAPTPPQKGIYLSLDESLDSLGDEGYVLDVEEDRIQVRANAPAGVFYAIQTLRQLLPPKVDGATAENSSFQLATAQIIDKPAYAWRAAMLDVARHFFSVAEVKQYINYLAQYKINILHLHLSDDQGWRIEIKSWPKLTSHGGKLEVGGTEGGFYTQEDYKELVRYAATQFITIVPEIDLPGHTNAALASYPELNCSGKAPDLYTGIEVGFSTLCLHKEVTFQFIDDVVKELAALTPSPYIHIGGDEAAATPKRDYIQFVNRFREIVSRHGKVMVGWEEIAQGNIDSTAIVQHWHSDEMATMAAAKGARVILSPATKVYLDMKYDSTTKLGLNWAAFIEVSDGYDWNPATHVAGLAVDKVLGIEAPLWSETLTNIDEIEYLAFPRLPGVAEKAWAATTDWNEYKGRLAQHGPRMSAMGIDYYRSREVAWP